MSRLYIVKVKDKGLGVVYHRTILMFLVPTPLQRNMWLRIEPALSRAGLLFHDTQIIDWEMAD